MAYNFSIDQLVGGALDVTQAVVKDTLNSVWTSIMCKVVKYDTKQRTVDVEPLIKWIQITVEGEVEKIQIAHLLDVPVMYASAGQFEMTFPIHVGDECLVTFSKQCIDNWWKKGGNQDPFEMRSFNISDGFAFFKPFNQEYIKELPEVDPENFMFRKEDEKWYLKLSPEGVLDIVGEKINMHLDFSTGDIAITNQGNTEVTTEGDNTFTLNGNNNVTISGTSDITVSKDMSVTVDGKADITIAKKLTIDGSDDVDIKSGGMINIEGSSMVTVEAPAINLGKGASNPAILSTQFIPLLNTHQHIGFMGIPTAPIMVPIVPPAVTSQVVKVK